MVETYVVMALYAATTFSVVLLNQAMESSWKLYTKYAAAFVGLVGFSGFFLWTLSVFAAKSGGYPYSYF